MSIMIRHLCFFVVLLIFVKCITAQSALKQERAKMNYCNPRYVTECHGITRRIGRGEPYKTNLTVTSRYTSDNNVTIRVVLYGEMTVELLKIKLCDISKVDWLFEYVKTYANIDSDCPYKPGSYGLYNLVFPPKNLPKRILILLEGKFYAKFYFLATYTEETIVETKIIFHAL